MPSTPPSAPPTVDAVVDCTVGLDFSVQTAVMQVLQLLLMNEHVCDGVQAQKTGSVHGRHDIQPSLRRSVQVS